MKWFCFSLAFIIFQSAQAQPDSTTADLFFINTSEAVLPVRATLNSTFENHFVFYSGLHLLLIEQKIDNDGNKWIRLGFEFENQIELESQNDVWLRAEDFYRLVLIEDVVLRMTYCYRYVKKYLLSKGFVDVYLPGVSAYMAADILPKHGFSKVSRKPSQATTYDVCVYKGGPSGHGHIEVLDPKGWYYGYGYKSQPIKNRTFISCFYKKINAPLP